MLASIKSWWDSPYQDNMSATRWFMFAGLMIVVGIIWSIIIKNLTD